MREAKPNSGGLWKNDRRTKDTHPQATGAALIECPHCELLTHYFMDAWTNQREGGKWQKVQFKVKDKQVAAQPERAQPVGDDEDIPF